MMEGNFPALIVSFHLFKYSKNSFIALILRTIPWKPRYIDHEGLYPLL